MEFPHGHPLMGDDMWQFIFLDKLIAINMLLVAIKIKVPNNAFEMTQVNEEIFPSIDLRD